MSNLFLDILMASTMIAAVFYGCLFIWEFICRFNPKFRELSILFEDEKGDSDD